MRRPAVKAAMPVQPLRKLSTQAARRSDPVPRVLARRPAAALTLAVALLAGCAAYGPGELKRGDAAARVEASMGVPTLRLPTADGTRLVYARGPEGQHTWMVDLDREGRVVRWHQALGEAAFEALPKGLTRDEVLFRLGPPARRTPLQLTGGEFWSYRYPTNLCLWYQIDFDAQGRLLGGGYGPDPRCDRDDDRLPR